ncbi:MAG: hypothetical protein IPI92_10110 [Gemmatimonadetes bacterium]|nr:hypothetical protein [Gemmatimonadota bacterium]MBK9069123.1 hypothetical protein [Gemmatimonadota bacterium]
MSAQPLGAEQWLAARTAGGPERLRARVLERAGEVTEGDGAAERLALAAERVLAIVEEHPGDRAIALDLLAADALITLALLAQAEQAPEQLGAFAAGLLSAERIA